MLGGPANSATGIKLEMMSTRDQISDTAEIHVRVYCRVPEQMPFSARRIRIRRGLTNR